MKKKLLSTLFVVGSAMTSHAQIPTEMTNRYQTVMDSLTTNVLTTTGQTFGISFAITIPGYGSWQGASGQADAGVPLTTNMTMGIASCGKLYTSVIMLKLQEAGVLSLDDTIEDWIDGPLPNVDKTVTIRQLLLHQSGIFDIINDDSDTFWGNVFANPDAFWSYSDALTLVGEPRFDKGTAYRYSNTGYLLAAYIIEEATGNSFAHNLHQYITEPLNLNMTFEAATDTAALSNVEQSASYAIDIWWPGLGAAAATSLARGMGSIVATPQDVVAFYQAVFNNQFLSPESMEQLLDFESASGFGLGVQERFSSGAGATIYGHSGSYIGFQSEAFHDPKTGASFFLISNTEQTATFINPYITRIYRDNFPKKANDAGISQIVSPRSTVCGQEVSATVELKNFGNSALTAVTINYQVDNGTAQTHAWTGNLASGQTANVTLPQMAITQGIHDLHVWTSLPNGAAEGNLYNDKVTGEFELNAEGTLPSTFNEGFEGTQAVRLWNPAHSTSHQWGVTNLSSASGNGSVVINNFSNAIFGAESFIDLPMLQLGTGAQELSFTYAYSAFPGSNDALQVLASTDCGATWTSIYAKWGTLLSMGHQTSDYGYFPQTEGEWHTETIALDAYAGNDVLLRFRAVNDFGNNLFLDDLRVGTALGIADRNSNIIKVYPNPASDKVTVAGLPEGTVVSIYNLSGQKILELVANGDTAIDISGLAKGMYFLNTAKGSAKIIKK